MLGPKHFSSKNQIIGGLFGIFWIGLTALLGTYRENVQNSDQKCVFSNQKQDGKMTHYQILKKIVSTIFEIHLVDTKIYPNDSIFIFNQ